jgi:septal ring factor EnvC (AmiA/AmiB activator)
MKTIIPWLCAAACAVAAFFFYSSSHKQAAELTTLRARSQEVEQLRADVEQLKTTGNESQQKEITRLRKDTADVLKLRAEVTQLRNDKKQLTQKITTLQAAPQATPDVQQLQAENQQLRGTIEQADQRAALNKCINNLRQMDGAKQQWALENKMTDAAIPTADNIAPYLKGGVVPQCPAGGVYTLGAVNTDPTCSIPGHALPTP